MMNCMTNCQYASYILLIQEHKKSHLVEKRLKTTTTTKTKTTQIRKNYPLGRMFPYHYHPSTRKCDKKKHEDRGYPFKSGGDTHRLR